MSKVKSFSVGNGDMFFINHNSDNFTTIDCCLTEDVKDDILDEIESESSSKNIKRFISTHPDDDHIGGLVDYDNKFGILNFYRVDNATTKKGTETDDFKRYKKLRDDSKKSFALKKGCKRKWMNESDNERKTSGLSCLWPITDNQMYQKLSKLQRMEVAPITYRLQLGMQQTGFLFFGWVIWKPICRRNLTKK